MVDAEPGLDTSGTPERGRVVLLMGVCGSGKTSVGQAVAESLGIEFHDADAFHSDANKAKMASGTPLTDADRWPWLEALAEQTALWEREKGALLACSALKRSYRAVLQARCPSLLVVYLDVPAPALKARMAARKGHFMPPSLVDSQLETLEAPTASEGFGGLVRVPQSLAVSTVSTVAAFVCEQLRSAETVSLGTNWESNRWW